ncbi:hypothetical protein J3F84DRAFT_398894 [Trichoderma pleuroticola]
MPYLTKEELEAIFSNQPLANGGPFWTRVAEDVNWTIMGSGPGTGHYTNLAELRANTIEKLMKALRGPLELKIVHVFFGGENYAWTTMELEARGIRKSVIQWNDEGRVIAVRNYLDTAVIEEVWKEAGEMGLF